MLRGTKLQQHQTAAACSLAQIPVSPCHVLLTTDVLNGVLLLLLLLLLRPGS
jgi:hypothetical protein